MASPGQPRERRVRLEADERRDQILAAAHRLFAERPYASVSISDLAEAAGTTRTNLHYYFGTKRALHLEVVRQFGRLPTLPPDPEARATGEQELDRLMARWLEVLEHNPQIIVTMLEASAPGADREVARVFMDGQRAWQDRLTAVLELPPTTTTRALLRAYQGMVAVAVAEWLRDGTLTRDEVHRLLTSTLLNLARIVS